MLESFRKREVTKTQIEPSPYSKMQEALSPARGSEAPKADTTKIDVPKT